MARAPLAWSSEVQPRLTFHDLPLVPCGTPRRSRALAGILGVPYDLGSTGRTGSDLAPDAIRQASHLRGELSHVELGISLFAADEVFDAGDVNVSQSSVQASLDAVARDVGGVADMSELVIMLGGNHSITVPAVIELARREGPLSLIVFDAHLDTWQEEPGVAPRHGSMLYRCIESGAVNRGTLFGWRGYGPNETHRLWAMEHGLDVWTMADVERSGLAALVSQASQTALGKAYLSIDIDVVDPGFAPGTGTPEPGGFTSRELLSAVRLLAATTHVVGADVVEVCPPFDQAGVTAMLAHRCVLEILAGAAHRRASRDGGPDIGFGP